MGESRNQSCFVGVFKIQFETEFGETLTSKEAGSFAQKLKQKHKLSLRMQNYESGPEEFDGFYAVDLQGSPQSLKRKFENLLDDIEKSGIARIRFQDIRVFEPSEVFDDDDEEL